MGGVAMQVSKWGNSLAIRLPASVVDVLSLSEGDEVEVLVADARVFQIAKKASPSELLEKLRLLRGKLPADFKFDREAANAR